VSERPTAAHENAGRGVAWLLETVSRGAALAGGFLLLGVMAMTVISVAGRYLFAAPILGDYEITELASGVAVFAFLPYCHMRGGNIVVEYFTSDLGERSKTWLDAVHNLAFTGVAGLITWRLIVGGLHKMADGETTLFLGIPVTWGYFPAVIGAAILTLVCVFVLVRAVRALRR
jgi:TRAP-type C4-dicarboxylate transport system permease small subunit